MLTVPGQGNNSWMHGHMEVNSKLLLMTPKVEEIAMERLLAANTVMYCKTRFCAAFHQSKLAKQ